MKNSEKSRTAWPKSKQPKTRFLMKNVNEVRYKIEFKYLVRHVRVVMLPTTMNCIEFVFRDPRSQSKYLNQNIKEVDTLK